MRSIDKTLALWAAGLLDSRQVVEWAGRQIAALDEPAYELIELVTCGPQACLKRAEADFAPRPCPMTYEEGFAVRALAANLDDLGSVMHFADWAARHCMAEDLGHPFVVLGYRLDHLIDDCGDKQAAAELVRAELPKLLSTCAQIASGYADSDG